MHRTAGHSATLALAALLAAHPALPAQESRPLTRWETQARAMLEELVEINTTHSTGSTVEASEAMARHMLAAGFPAGDVTVVEHAPRKGNLVVRLRGRSRTRTPILLLSHHDVVEADPADWTLPPFEFIERDGTFYGRGVADDKDEGAIHLTILLRMRAEGFVPDRDIIVALTADEEGGPENGVRWLLENRRDLIDAEYALNEGGGGRVESGRRISNDVQASEKKVANFLLETTNPGGHSSVPRPDNAIYALARALLAWRGSGSPCTSTRSRAPTSRGRRGSSAARWGPPCAPSWPTRATPAPRRCSRATRRTTRLRTTCVATMLTAATPATRSPSAPAPTSTAASSRTNPRTTSAASSSPSSRTPP
jgi:hypothetical protein